MLRTAFATALKTHARAVPRTAALAAPRRAMSSSSAEADSVTFEFESNTFEGYNIDTPAASVTLSKADAVALYRDMQTVRRLEMAADSSY
ncbi:hypothetical protein H4S06_003446, partial [Coemansia sp. BCRC 34490]